jgi:hypothetical protein
MLFVMLGEEERSKCLAHLWDASVGAKEDILKKKSVLVRSDS